MINSFDCLKSIKTKLILQDSVDEEIVNEQCAIIENDLKELYSRYGFNMLAEYKKKCDVLENILRCLSTDISIEKIYDGYSPSQGHITHYNIVFPRGSFRFIASDEAAEVLATLPGFFVRDHNIKL